MHVELCACSDWNGFLGPFLEGPEKFSHPERHSKIANLMITELSDSMIFLIWTEVSFIQSFRPIHFSVFKIQVTKNGFAGPKSFRGFRETGPSSCGPAFNSWCFNWYWRCKLAISELRFVSVSKRVFVRNHSNENELDFHENGTRKWPFHLHACKLFNPCKNWVEIWSAFSSY